MNESLLPEVAVWDLFQPLWELLLAGLAVLLVVELGLMLALTISVGRGKTAGRFSCGSSPDPPATYFSLRSLRSLRLD